MRAERLWAGSFAALLATAMLAAGCFDFDSLGGGDLAQQTPADLGDVDLTQGSDDPDGGDCNCASGSNCIDGQCRLAPGDCTTLRAMFTPPSVPKDGVYWLMYGAAPHRAYCDMQTGSILCTDSPTGEAHDTRTRDGQHTIVNWTSQLLPGEAACKLWNVRAGDQRPFSPLTKNSQTTLTTCQALGFPRDISVGSCKYGMQDTGTADDAYCGFSPPDWFVYYNNCAVRTATNGGCAMGGGELGFWRPQGPMYNVGVLSNASGSIFTTCATR